MASSRNTTNLTDTFQQKARIEELSDSNSDSESEGLPFPGKHLKHKHAMPLPPWLSSPVLSLFPEDWQAGASSEAFDKTLKECLPHLLGEDTQSLPLNKYGIPHLRREQHIKYLHASLEDLPAPFVALDAARPWVFYWALNGLSTLGEDVSSYRDRLTGTLRPLQNPQGGFGGGHGQMSHCATSYACILSLALVKGLEQIDRKAMWHWLGSLKQPNGSFRMAVNAEEDVRGAFCAFIIITILNLPLTLPPDSPAVRAGLSRFDTGLGEYITSLQTFEGGIGASTAGNEAHGAYAFLALGTLSLLGPPHETISKYLDLPSLTRWMTLQQTAPEGGFAGRTNKLVDACYSWWVGGAWALLQAALSPPSERSERSSHPHSSLTLSKGPDIWNRKALIHYLLTCAQQSGSKGGMRDKPSCRPDGYHTNYSLAGLGAAMWRYTYDETRGESGQARFTAALNWRAERVGAEELGIEEVDRVAMVHPVYVLPFGIVEGFRAQFAEAGGFCDVSKHAEKKLRVENR
jgi:protein farnesyltransferase subunit beta